MSQLTAHTRTSCHFNDRYHVNLTTLTQCKRCFTTKLLRQQMRIENDLRSPKVSFRRAPLKLNLTQICTRTMFKQTDTNVCVKDRHWPTFEKCRQKARIEYWASMTTAMVRSDVQRSCRIYGFLMEIVFFSIELSIDRQHVILFLTARH